MTEQLKAEAYVRSQRPALIKSICPRMQLAELLPINLQDWLAALGEKNIVLIDIVTGGDIAKASVGETYITLNLITGQPNSPEDYLAFNNITRV